MRKDVFLKTAMLFMLMAVLFIPVMVFADEEEEDYCCLWVGGIAVIESGPVTGEGITGTVTYDGDENILTLENATITGLNTIREKDDPDRYETKDSNIYSKDWGLTIVLIGDNTVGDTDKTQIGIQSEDELTITGSGKLSVKSDYFGIWATKNCMLDNTEVSLFGKDNSGISANKDLIIDDSKLIADSDTYEGIRAQGSILINNSDVKANATDDSAINTNYGDMTIINSSVYAKSVYTSESQYIMHAIEADRGRIRISHSSIEAYCDGMSAVQARKKITLGGSDIITPAEGTIGQNEDGYTIKDKDGKDAKEVLVSVSKHPSTMAADGKTVSLKSKGTKTKKTITVSKAKAYTILNANGNVTFKKVKANKSSGNFKVNTKTGKITVKKGTKNGTYKLTVKISDSGDETHYGKDVDTVVTIKIKK